MVVIVIIIEVCPIKICITCIEPIKMMITYLSIQNERVSTSQEMSTHMLIVGNNCFFRILTLLKDPLINNMNEDC